MKARKTALMGIMCALALALSFLENLIPALPFMPPGAKPGFSNIVTMFAAITMGLPQALCITAVKAAFAGVTRGFTAFCMSFFGGLLSTLVMYALVKLKGNNVGLVGIAIVSAVFHNIGQLCTAVVLTGTKAVLSYAPVLMIFSLVTGFVTGTILKVVMPALEKQSKHFLKK